LSEDSLKVQVSRIRDAKGGQIVVIKPMETSTYENLVNVLDEIQICSIGIYALSEIADGDKKLIENYLINM